jgi:hypothetical protein
MNCINIKFKSNNKPNGYKPFKINAENPARIRMKSAVTSKNAPEEDSESNFLAKNPSIPSVKTANTKIPIDHNIKPSINVKKKKGAIINLIAVIEEGI